MQSQILFLSNSASSRAIVHAALNSSEQMAAVSCADIPEFLQQFCQHQNDVMIIEPEKFAAADIDILLRFIPQFIPVLYLIEEQSPLDDEFLEKHRHVEILIKLPGYLTALPYLIQNLIYKKYNNLNSFSAPLQKMMPLPENGWCELGSDLKIQRCSSTLEKLLEFSQKDLTRFKLPDLFHADSREEIYRCLADESAENDDSLQETRFRNQAGEARFFVVHFHRIRNHLQETTGWRCDFFYQANYRPATLSSEKNKTLAEKLTGLLQADYKMTFPIFFRSIAEKCTELIDCEQLTLVRYNKTSGKFISDAIRGPELPVAALLQKDEITVFAPRRDDSAQLYFFSVENDLTLSAKANHIKTPPGFDLDGGILLPFAEPDSTPIGCIAVAGLPELAQNDGRLQQLDIISLLITLILRTFHEKAEQEKRERRLQQILVTGSIFKLQLPMRSLMREMAWAIKFSFDAFLSALALFDKKDGSLGFYAVASDDKHLILSLAEEKVHEDKFLACLKSGKTIRKSHLLANIGVNNDLDLLKGTSGAGLIVTPITDIHGKMMGAIILCERRNIPVFDLESITILETIAKQIAVGISNRVIYSRALKQQTSESTAAEAAETNGRIAKPEKKAQRFWKRIFS